MKKLFIILSLFITTSLYASQFTTNLNLEIPAIGDRDWQPVISRDIISIDSAISNISVNVKNFGATGDGTTNDSAAIQAAIDSLITGGIVLLPVGTFNLGTTGLTISSACELRGVGRPVYSGAYGTRLKYSGTGSAITTSGSVWIVLRDFQVWGNSTGTNGIKFDHSYGMIDNVLIDGFTNIGLYVHYATAMKIKNVNSELNKIGMQIDTSFACYFDNIGLHDSTNEGLLLSASGAGSAISYNEFRNFIISNSGYEAINNNGTVSLKNNLFENFHMEHNLKDPTYANGKYVFNFAGSGWSSMGSRNFLKNILFSTITSPWDGATGNRALFIQGGRWFIEGIQANGSGITGQDYFVAADDNSCIIEGNFSLREWERWNLVNCRANLAGSISRVYHSLGFTTTGTGEDTLSSYTIIANTVGNNTQFVNGVPLTTTTSEIIGGCGGIKITAAGFKTGAGGNKTINVKFGGTVVATVPAANDTNAFLIEVVLFNTSVTGVGSWSGYSKVIDASTFTQARITAFAKATTSDIAILFTGECADAGDLVTSTVFMVERI